MKIAILDDYQDEVRKLDCFSLLDGHEVQVFNQTYSEAELISKLVEFEGLVLIRERTVISENLLAQLPKLKVISQTGKVSNHIDVALCDKYQVKVLEGAGSPIAPAELCWALIMSAYRHIPAYVENLRQGQWQQSGSLGLGRTLHGKTLGIWGYGKIGQRIAQFAKTFGMQVLVWGREPSRELALSHGFMSAETKQAFFENADIVSLHLRLNEATKHCVSREDLAVMKPDAMLVNISRAELIEEGALLADMQSNRGKQAVVDVYEQEPIVADSEALLSLDNVICSPHLGYVEQGSYQLYFKIAFENIVAFSEGNPQNVAQIK